MTQNILVINAAEKRYKTDKGDDLLAITNLSLEVEKNSFISILGPSGCGKSTLLRVIAGLEKLSAGSIAYQGAMIDGYQPGISMVFQDYSLFPWRTVLDNVTMALEFAGVGRRARAERGYAFLKLVGLEHFAKAYPHELSGGMRQRIAMVRALVNDPQLLLMDEPFGALDAHTRIILQNELVRIWEQNKKTILFVTHSVDEAVYLSDTIAIMTRRPGTLKEMVPVNLPRPRDRGDSTYAKLLSQVLDLLGEEVASLQ